MTDLISVLIADDNSEFCKIMRDNINKAGDMQVIGTAGDGKAAIKMIHELEPDIILLDIIMPRLDGIGVLEEIRTAKSLKKSLICVFTAIGGDIVVRKALELGADFYIMKPFDTDVLLTRIRQLYKEKCSDDKNSGYFVSGNQNYSTPYMHNTEQIITDLIKSIGVTPNLSGYIYLREAVMLAVSQPDRMKNISKCIYPELAREHCTNVRNIDRAIRCAMLSAQKKTKRAENSDKDAIIVINSSKNPNNTQIIRFLAEKTIQNRLPDIF